MDGGNRESVIPPQAEEVLDQDWGGGRCRWRCVVGGRTVGYRYRQSDTLLLEYEVDAEGRMHGRWREWYEDGAPLFDAEYVHGREHGVARQYGRDGRLIGTYHMHHGTGVDLWRNEDGALLEERQMRDGQRQGFERWWTGDSDNQVVWEERHFSLDREHGIFRAWNHQGRLRRGYPRYFANGERLTKRQYLTACALDPTLPPFDPEDNRPKRQLPDEYLNPG